MTKIRIRILQYRVLSVGGRQQQHTALRPPVAFFLPPCFVLHALRLVCAALPLCFRVYVEESIFVHVSLAYSYFRHTLCLCCVYACLCDAARQRQEAQWKLAQERRMQAEREQLEAQLSLLKLQGEAVREIHTH